MNEIYLNWMLQLDNDVSPMFRQDFEPRGFWAKRFWTLVRDFGLRDFASKKIMSEEILQFAPEEIMSEEILLKRFCTDKIMADEIFR